MNKSKLILGNNDLSFEEKVTEGYGGFKHGDFWYYAQVRNNQGYYERTGEYLSDIRKLII